MAKLWISIVALTAALILCMSIIFTGCAQSASTIQVMHDSLKNALAEPATVRQIVSSTVT